METVRQHPLVGAEMTKKFPKCLTTEKLNALSYEICRHHHERYDGTGYPDGLQEKKSLFARRLWDLLMHMMR